MTESYLLSVVRALCVLAGKTPMYNRVVQGISDKIRSKSGVGNEGGRRVRMEMRRLRTNAACEAPSGSTVSKFASHAVVPGRREFSDSPGVTRYDFTAAWGGGISSQRA